MFLTSVFVPSDVDPRGRIETFASQRSEPSCILTSDTPMYESTALSSREIRFGFLRGCDVRLAHDLHQRHAGAVVIDERVLGTRHAAAGVDILAGILFEMDAIETHRSCPKAT